MKKRATPRSTKPDAGGARLRNLHPKPGSGTHGAAKSTRRAKTRLAVRGSLQLPPSAMEWERALLLPIVLRVVHEVVQDTDASADKPVELHEQRGRQR